MKNIFFGISALALLLAGCDDGTSDPSDVGAGTLDATPVTKPDATAEGSVPLSYTPPARVRCTIPASTLNASIPTAPRHMYRFLINAEQFSCSMSGTSGPTDCKSPANGFSLSASDPWCCVNTYPVPLGKGGDLKSAESAYLLEPSLKCGSMEAGSLDPASTREFLGQVALCSADGKFMGWDCNL